MFYLAQEMTAEEKKLGRVSDARRDVIRRLSVQYRALDADAKAALERKKRHTHFLKLEALRPGDVEAGRKKFLWDLGDDLKDLPLAEERVHAVLAKYAPKAEGIRLLREAGVPEHTIESLTNRWDVKVAAARCIQAEFAKEVDETVVDETESFRDAEV
jgi:hypothetical protein